MAAENFAASAPVRNLADATLWFTDGFGRRAIASLIGDSGAGYFWKTHEKKKAGLISAGQPLLWARRDLNPHTLSGTRT
jgi:hypothetical protein